MYRSLLNLLCSFHRHPTRGPTVVPSTACLVPLPSIQKLWAGWIHVLLLVALSTVLAEYLDVQHLSSLPACHDNNTIQGLVATLLLCGITCHLGINHLILPSVSFLPEVSSGIQHVGFSSIPGGHQYLGVVE